MSKLPELPANPTSADMNAFMNVMAKNVELLTAISTDLKTLNDIKTECTAVKDILSHTLVDDIVDAAVVQKQLDITSETSKLARLVSENNNGIKQTNLTLAEVSNIAHFFKEKWKTIAIWGSVIVLVFGTFTVWKTWALERSDKIIADAFINYQKNISQAPIYHFDYEGHAYVIARTGDTLWISTKKPNN